MNSHRVVELTEATAHAAVETIRREMKKHFPSLSGKTFSVDGNTWRSVTVGGIVSPEAAAIYESYSDNNYLSLRHHHHHAGVMIFQRRIIFEHDVALLTEALLTLFSCQELALYLLD